MLTLTRRPKTEPRRADVCAEMVALAAIVECYTDDLMDTSRTFSAYLFTSSRHSAAAIEATKAVAVARYELNMLVAREGAMSLRVASASDALAVLEWEAGKARRLAESSRLEIERHAFAGTL